MFFALYFYHRHQSSRLNSPGSFATLMAIRRASSAVSILAYIASTRAQGSISMVKFPGA
jgi:hypothetical protein